MTRILIAEDEALLAAEIGEELARVWPAAEVCATVHDGHAALRAIEEHRPNQSGFGVGVATRVSVLRSVW